MLVPCPKALHGARIAWTSDFDDRDLLCHGREYPAQQATRTSYLLAGTEERSHQLSNLLQRRTCGSNSKICEE